MEVEVCAEPLVRDSDSSSNLF